MEIILASKSPRRVELLQQFNIKFRVQVANVPEEQRDSPKQPAISNASAKARAVLELFPRV